MDANYYLDLPDTTVTMDEARIIAERPGYAFALDNENKRLGERQFDPVQRHFTYAEHDVAASEASYLFFDLWCTPADTPMVVTAAAFDVLSDWEDRLVVH